MTQQNGEQPAKRGNFVRNLIIGKLILIALVAAAVWLLMKYYV